MTKVLIDVEDDLWLKFKSISTREKTLNEILVDMIRKEVEESEKTQDKK